MSVSCCFRSLFQRQTLAAVALASVAGAAMAQTIPTSLAPPRVFARGVETTIAPEVLPEETLAVHPMIEITGNPALDWQPQVIAPSSTLFQQAQNVRFSHEVWGLEFKFKPLRMIKHDGRLIWYMVYRVTNNGDRLKPVLAADGSFTAEPAEAAPVEFSPHFVLEGQDVDATGQKIYKAYLDRLVPSAVEAIRQREVPDQVLLTSVEMASTPIPVSSADDEKSVWGVVMWEGIDPEMDFLSVFVGGLTNAYVWSDTPGAWKSGDPIGKGRRLVSKTLQLNFWRPGDQFDENEREIRFGTPPGRAALYGVEEGVAHRWTFR